MRHKIDEKTLEVRSELEKPGICKKEDWKKNWEEKHLLFWKIKGTALYLIPGLWGTFMGFVLVTQDPGTSMEWDDGPGPYVHDGEEWYYVLEGEIEVTIGDKKFLMKEGDFTLFPAFLPHHWRNPGKMIAKILVSESTGSFKRKDYYEHLSPEDREEAFRRIHEYYGGKGSYRIAVWRTYGPV